MQTGKEGVARRMQSVSICQQAAEEPGSNNSSGSSTLVCFMVSATRLSTGPTPPNVNHENTHVKTRPEPAHTVHHTNIMVESRMDLEVGKKVPVSLTCQTCQQSPAVATRQTLN